MTNKSILTNTAVRESLKSAWYDCYHRLAKKDAENPSDELETYKAWLEWYESGQMPMHPMFNITLGYTLARGVIEGDLSDMDMNEAKELYVAEGTLAIKELIEETEDTQ